MAPELLHSRPALAHAMPTSSTISFDDSLWPLLVVKFTGVPTTPQVVAYLEELTRYMERGERYVILSDSSEMRLGGSSEQRLLQVEWMKRHEARLRELQLGIALVTTSPVVRLAMSLVFFIKPSPSPYIVAATAAEAAAWAARKLEESGLHAEAEHIREHFQLPPAPPRAPGEE